MDRPSMAAYVLTCHAPTAAAEAISMLRAQDYPGLTLTLIDNSSGRVDHSALAAQGVRVLYRDNDGPAGGWAAAVDDFRAGESDLIVLLDDDVSLGPGGLQAAASATGSSDLVLPLRDGGASFAWLGVVLRRDAVERLGRPKAEYVYWCEDTEYLQRRPRLLGLRVGTDPSYTTEAKEARSVTTLPDWKLYYMTRNSVQYRVYEQRLEHPVKLLHSVAHLLLQALSTRRVSALGAVTRGLRDGARNRLGLLVPLTDPHRPL